MPPRPSPISWSYAYNLAQQRTRATLEDGAYWRYEYDKLGQLASGKKYWSDGTPVPGMQFEYGFDDIGNRQSTKAGGNQNGTGLRPASYGANLLSQYTNRTVPGGFDVLGAANATNAVTVNASPADYRRGEFFQELITANNTNAAIWQSVKVTNSATAAYVTGNVFVAQSPETFTHDADGNLLTDGRWRYTWDAENRLVQVESLSSPPTGSRRKVAWEFDGAGRRIRQTTWDGSSGSDVVVEDLKWLSDGWRCVAKLNATNGAVVRSYAWGLDLSGSLGGAGGVGGLLWVTRTAQGTHFCAYDGNGNVSALVSATDGTVSARYEYGPFGEPLRARSHSLHGMCIDTRGRARVTTP